MHFLRIFRARSVLVCGVSVAAPRGTIMPPGAMPGRMLRPIIGFPGLVLNVTVGMVYLVWVVASTGRARAVSRQAAIRVEPLPEYIPDRRVLRTR